MFRPKYLFIIITMVVSIMMISCSQKAGVELDLLLQSDANIRADKISALLRTSDTSGISEFMQDLLLVAAELADSYEKGKAYYVAGNYFTHSGNYNLAHKNYAEAYTIANNLDSLLSKKLRANILLNNSLMYYENGDYEPALTMCLEAEVHFQQTDDHYGLAMVYNRLGGIYLQLNNIEKANYYNRKAWANSELENNSDLKVVVMNGYGNYLLHAHSDSSEKALLIYDQVRQLAEEKGNKKVISDSWYNQAFYFSQLQDYNKALELYHCAYEWACLSKNQYDICDALYKIGLMHYYLEDYETSRDTLFSALGLAQETGSKTLQRNTYDVLGYLEIATGNHIVATEYLNKNLDLVYEIFSQEERRQVSFLEAKYQAQKRENQIIIQGSRLQKQSLIIYGTIFLLAIILTITILIIRTLQQKQVIGNQQSEIQKKIIYELQKDKELIATQAVLKGEETERTRIARDLHDGLGGMISGVKLTLDNMKTRYIIDNETSELFNKALEMINLSARELRRVAHNMMPELLLQNGLEHALEAFCQPLSHKDKLAVIFKAYGKSRRMEVGFELTIYRIAQELINNSIKHSGASEIIIELVQEFSRISLNIRDNGKGFDTKTLQFATGTGIPNIHSRVNSYGGIFDIYSEPGKGSEFMVSFEGIPNIIK